VATCVFSQVASAALIRDRRCDTWGDTLNTAEATQRIAFALSCKKDSKIIREIKMAEKGLIAKDGSSSLGYPSYGWFNDAISDYQNPKSWFAPPRLASGAKVSCSLIPADYEVAFYCASGCYTPDQQILSDEGPVAIGQASSMNLASVQTLTADSSLDQLHYQSGHVLSYISDAQAGNQDVLRLKMLSGGELRVTLNHPLVNAKGEVAQAQSFREGDLLVKADGQLDPILSIKKENFYGKVVNLRMTSEDLKENILVAQGYLNGSVRYQNEYVAQMNRQLLRSVVAHHLMRE